MELFLEEKITGLVPELIGHDSEAIWITRLATHAFQSNETFVSIAQRISRPLLDVCLRTLSLDQIETLGASLTDKDIESLSGVLTRESVAYLSQFQRNRRRALYLDAWERANRGWEIIPNPRSSGSGFDNPYYHLGVSRNATKAQITTAYRHLASLFHGDRDKSEESDALFKAGSEAYKLLSDPERRRELDRTLPIIAAAFPHRLWYSHVPAVTEVPPWGMPIP